MAAIWTFLFFWVARIVSRINSSVRVGGAWLFDGDEVLDLVGRSDGWCLPGASFWPK